MSDKVIGKPGAPVGTVHERLPTDVSPDFGTTFIVTPEGENVSVARIERNQSDRIFVGVDGARYLKIEKAGDSLSHVARRYNCTLQELKVLNPGLRRSDINSQAWARKPRGDFDFLKLDADFVKLPETAPSQE